MDSLKSYIFDLCPDIVDEIRYKESFFNVEKSFIKKLLESDNKIIIKFDNKIINFNPEQIVIENFNFNNYILDKKIIFKHCYFNNLIIDDSYQHQIIDFENCKINNFCIKNQKITAYLKNCEINIFYMICKDNIFSNFTINGCEINDFNIKNVDEYNSLYFTIYKCSIKNLTMNFESKIINEFLFILCKINNFCIKKTHLNKFLYCKIKKLIVYSKFDSYLHSSKIKKIYEVL